VEPPTGEPPVPELFEQVAQQLPPASEAPPSQKKKQRRRSARVASSVSLVAAALPANAELSRALSEIEREFGEPAAKKKGPARKRRARRANPAVAPSESEAPRRRAANAV